MVNGVIAVVALATVVAKERDGETKEYQGIYNKAFLVWLHYAVSLDWLTYTDNKIS